MSLPVMPAINLPRNFVSRDAECAHCRKTPQNDGGKEWIAHQDLNSVGQTYTVVDPAHKDCVIAQSDIGQTAIGAHIVFSNCMRCYNANNYGAGVILDLSTVGVYPEEIIRRRTILSEEKKSRRSSILPLDRPRSERISDRIKTELGHILINHASKVGCVA